MYLILPALNPRTHLLLFLAFNGTHKPANWPQPVYMLDPSDVDNNGYKNERLIVWMRTAALPTFRKLHGRVNHDSAPFEDGLPKGNYTVTIGYSILYTEINLFILFSLQGIFFLRML